MAFNINSLPSKVQTAFMNRDLSWDVAYWAAREAGISDLDRLADILFYKLHPELWMPGGECSKLDSSMANYSSLAQEWKNLRQLAVSLSYGSPSSGKSSSWKPYDKSSFSESSGLSSSVKDWLSKPPKHELEVGLFISNREDNGNKLFFLGWKTNNAKERCRFHGIHEDSALHGWFELKTSISGLKEKHDLPTDIFSILGNDAGAKGISLMNQFVNIRMLRYVFINGQCPIMASSRAWREVREDGVNEIKNALAILGVAGGAKPGSVKPGVSGPNQVLHNLSKLNWKGFTKQIYAISQGNSGRTASVHSIAQDVPVDMKISGNKGGNVGYIRYFD